MNLYYLTLLPLVLALSFSIKEDFPWINEDTKQNIVKATTHSQSLTNARKNWKITVRGKVHSRGKGIPNVVVSDGYLVTKTDQGGFYQLASNKHNGYIFISPPGDYEVPTKQTVPQFFQQLSSSAFDVEVKDFELYPSTGGKHVMAFLADMHLAKRNEDLEQFQRGFIKDIQELAAAYKANDTKFYALTLGDQSWDAYWYKNNFGLPEYLAQLQVLDFPIFNTIGNHDNDPYVANDWLSEVPYRRVLGPTYYSFNIGEAHYVVLDNVVFKNHGGAPGTVGDRDYNVEITENQIAWLKKDLAMLPDKHTPIILAMHIPMHSNPKLGATHTVIKNASALQDCLQSFENVKIFTGHTHINYRVTDSESTLQEYNIGAVCATWWWTGRKNSAGNHICKDGSPGGYAVMETDARKQVTFYKSIGFSKDYQFRSYDLNTIHITAEEFTPKANHIHQKMVQEYAGNYANANKSNEILLNIWGYRKGWKIAVKENGKLLTVKQVHQKDPLHVISYTMGRLNANATPTPAFVSANTSHLFLSKATKPNTTLEISVTDDQGQVFTETMTRPKTFSYNIH
ncbi:calcineurin-like phosphoesterase C-terminal domain-containing protein [Sphingobacterium suaedae]|uniref:Calcineurin-like phosphoesterase C-terminal domain-containing protein n=1 Tax=Sphingobacterium suaedae TaxID=1686402 RepID=A0ABW5KFW0_9SPHI